MLIFGGDDDHYFHIREGEKLPTELCNEQETGMWGGESDLIRCQERSNKRPDEEGSNVFLWVFI